MARHIGKFAEIAVIACDRHRASRGESCSITVGEVHVYTRKSFKRVQNQSNLGDLDAFVQNESAKSCADIRVREIIK